MKSLLWLGMWGSLLTISAGAAMAGASNTPPAVLTFQPSLFATPPAPTPPDWISSVGYELGELVGGDRPAWQASASLPEGRGMVWLDLQRDRMNEDLALTLLHEEEAGADLSVQLWDAKGEVVALDLFKNALAMATEARTDTFILPLRQYPTATRIVLHRMSGGMRLSGVVLTPVVTPQDSDLETLLETARRFGNPVSPEGDLMRRIEAARRAMTPAAAAAAAQPAVLRPAVEPAAPAPPRPFSFAGHEWVGLRTEFAVANGTVRPLPRARPGFNYGHWGHGRGAALLTGVGDKSWRDYSIEFDLGMSGPDATFNPYRVSSNEFSVIVGVRVVSWPENWNEDGMSACHIGFRSDGLWGVSINRGVFCDQPVGYGRLKSVEGRSIASGKGIAVNPDKGNHVRIEVRGDRLRGWVDDRALFDLTEAALRSDGEGVRLDHGGVLVHWVWESQGWISNYKATPLAP
jgi:hypothetical protein